MVQLTSKHDLNPLLHPLHELIEAEQQAFIDGADGRKRAGYFCTYTPPEVLSAAGLRHVRLFKAGSPEIVSQGERLTQSVFCDFSKSCLGAFDAAHGDPLYRAVERLYNFHTCASMKRVSEVLADEYVPTAMLNLPQLYARPRSREFYRDEIAHYASDVADFAGQEIAADALRAQIALFNRLRRLNSAICARSAVRGDLLGRRSRRRRWRSARSRRDRTRASAGRA